MTGDPMFERLSALEDPGPGAGPLVRLHVGEDALPTGASGAIRLPAPPSVVWPLIRDVEGYPRLVRMIHRGREEDGEASIVLRFRIAVLSAKFGFRAAVHDEPERCFDLSYLSGEPKDIRLRFELEPIASGEGTLLRTAVTYDIYSLGFLVKFFLRHHPEIQHGVYPGTVLSLFDSVRVAAERARSG